MKVCKIGMGVVERIIKSFQLSADIICSRSYHTKRQNLSVFLIMAGVTAETSSFSFLYDK